MVLLTPNIVAEGVAAMRAIEITSKSIRLFVKSPASLTNYDSLTKLGSNLTKRQNGKQIRAGYEFGHSCSQHQLIK
jgi:hypothetical protein